MIHLFVLWMIGGAIFLVAFITGSLLATAGALDEIEAVKEAAARIIAESAGVKERSARIIAEIEAEKHFLQRAYRELNRTIAEEDFDSTEAEL